MNKSERVIEFIKAAGGAGRSFSEIQRFVVETLNGLNYDERAQPSSWAPAATPPRRYRGYWCNHLLGGMWTGPGLLRARGCKKNARGRWTAA